jgi:hypothetical protein
MESLTDVSALCDELDLKLSMWYPPYFVDYTTAETQAKAKSHLSLLCTAMKRLDVLFIPGGDPGGRHPKDFFPIGRQLAGWYREFFPSGEVWVSSQYGLSVTYDLGIEPWDPVVREQDWFDALHDATLTDYLTGAVYGPWSSHPLSEFRARVPSHLPVRHYADICHVLTCELPVDKWNIAFASTQHREPITIRPMTLLRVCEDTFAHADAGFGAYSEGVSDDVNKHVLNALYWGADLEGPTRGVGGEALLRTMLLQYSRLLVGMLHTHALQLVEAILGLEQNWVGEIASNGSIETTLATLRELEEQALPRQAAFSWRWHMILFRAYHDMFIKQRVVQEEAALRTARTGLSAACAGAAGAAGDTPDAAAVAAAVDLALATLRAPYREAEMSTSVELNVDAPEPTSVMMLYGKLQALAGLLRVNVGLQLTLAYGGQHAQRGAFLMLAWSALTDVPYVRGQLETILRDAAGDAHAVSLGVGRLLAQQTAEVPSFDTVWYASFGSGGAAAAVGGDHEEEEVSPSVSSVLAPHRPMELGEDPTFFARPYQDYLDTTNYELMEMVVAGKVPYTWRSWIVPVWPRISSLRMRFPLASLKRLDARRPLHVQITYVGEDLYQLGGDWAELGTISLPTRLLCNSVPLHDFMAPPTRTESRIFELPEASLAAARADGADGVLEFVVEPQQPEKVAFRRTAFPVAEFWILQKRP